MLPNLAILVFPEIIGYLFMAFEAQLLSSLPVVLNSTRAIHGGVVESLTFLITVARVKGAFLWIRKEAAASSTWNKGAVQTRTTQGRNGSGQMRPMCSYCTGS